jgi:hypothetical protein
MSRNRMIILLRFCRFDDATTHAVRAESEKLAPIRELWDMFLARLQICYIPGDSLKVDEQLIPSRGRCKFRQYMRSKPSKYGIKAFWCFDLKSVYPLKGKVNLGRNPGTTFLGSKDSVNELVKRLLRL